MKTKEIRYYLLVMSMLVCFSIVGSVLESLLRPLGGDYAAVVAIAVGLGGFWIVVIFLSRRYRK